MTADTDPDRGAFLAGMSEAEYAKRADTFRQLNPGVPVAKNAEEARAMLRGEPLKISAVAPDANVEALRELFLQRCQHGLLKYGVTTERTDIDLDDWLQHALEEAMDFCVYLQRCKAERAQQLNVDEVFTRCMIEAVAESKWIPKEYAANDWQNDVLTFLRDGIAAFFANGGIVSMSDKPVPPILGRERETVIPVKIDAKDAKAAIDDAIKDARRATIADVPPELLTALRQSARFDNATSFNAALQQIFDTLGVSASLAPTKPTETTYWYRERDDAFPLQVVWGPWRQCDYATFQRYYDHRNDHDNDVQVKTEPVNLVVHNPPRPPGHHPMG